MATFNVAGSSVVDLTPNHQADGRTPIQFGSTPFNVKTATNFGAGNYWKCQNTPLRFITRGTVSVGAKTKVVNALSTFVFNPGEYQNVIKIIVRNWSNSNTSSFTFTSSGIGTRVWPKNRIHSLTFAHSNSVVKRAVIALSQTTTLTTAQTNSSTHKIRYTETGSNSCTFTSSGNAIRQFPRTGVAGLTIGHSNSVVRARVLSAQTVLSLNSVGVLIFSENTVDRTVLVFSNTGTLRVTKNVRATHSLSFLSGGFGLVY